MAVSGDTDTLRASAAEWSLEGDRRLLDLLQSLHQKITSKCQETNSKLDEMVAALDDASVSLQNVNNRFMALSNTQFVESRVYEDDTDVATEPIPIKKPSDQVKRLEDTLLKGLVTLEAMHEPVTILDSDSDSDDDVSERESVILKPKDLYAERPLPYIIGSQNWKNKWHAGLILEDSDTESTTSRHSEKKEQFSESESEDEQTNIQPEMFYSISDAHQRVDSEESLYKPQMAKVYKPYPAAAALFPEEPPPLDPQESDWGPDPSSESEDDIFAELHRNEKRETQREQPPKPTPVTQKPNLFQEEGKEDANMFTETPSNPTIQKQDKTIEDQTTIKKPAGAISLFGSNKGAESIGAAILKRNQRKSSSDESEDTAPSRVPDNLIYEKKLQSYPSVERKVKEHRVSQEISDVKSKESSIFDELFAKSEKKSKEEVKKVDIFSDIFDDIDDIFTKDVKKEEKKPSLFDDELFSDVNTNKQTEKDLFKEAVLDEKTVDKVQVEKTKSSIFDDEDDDIFVKTDKKPASKSKLVKPDQEPSKISENTQKKKSIFDSDSDDGDIFSKIKPSRPFKDNIKPTNSSNTNVDTQTNKDINVTYEDSGSINAQANIVPNTSKTDNNIEVQPTKPVDFDKDVIFNSNKTKQTPSCNEVIKNNNEKASNDDWETDLPENEEENNTPIPVKVIEKPKIQEKPKVAENPTVNVKTVQKSPASVSTTDALRSESEKVIEKPKKGNKAKAKHVFDDIFGREEPPILEESPTPSINKPSSTKTDKIIRDKNVEANSKNQNKAAIKTQEQTDQMTKAQLENDIFDDLFLNQTVNKDNKLETADIFSDIPPPITEKPKETKSTNINALFGDDSDDESLFFKSEPAMDDVPPKSDALDTIFHDEPPDFDIDFLNESIPPKLEQFLPVNIGNTGESKIGDISANKHEAVDETDQSEAVKDDLTKRDKALIVNDKKIDDSDNIDATKPIGKLKPMNFNINVNTLLPGASPKKSVSKPDSAVTSPVKTMTDTVSPEPKLVKSVSFDSDPDSLVLDNKISKERAKIQVKRRPSTRRARKEAVRKSGIDFVDSKEPFDDIDTPDNADNKTAIVTDLSNSKSKKSIKDKSENVGKTAKNNVIEKLDTNIDVCISKTSEIVKEKSDKSTEMNEKDDIEKSVNTRVLNINNEDIYIFKEPDIENEQASKTVKVSEKIKVEEINKDLVLPKKTLSIFDDDDDDEIFGNIKQKKDPLKSENVLENVEFPTETDKIKEDLLKIPAKSGRRLVVADDDEDIFGAKKDKTKKKISTSTKITENNTDLFKTISKSTQNNQKSFLDNDDDDDDLFAFTKTASSLESSSKNTSSLETSTKSTTSFESGSKNDGVQTLGNVYKEQPNTTKLVENQITGNTKQGSIGKSIFDDSSDEELFGGKKSKKMADNLFSKGTDEESFSKKNTKKVAKTTLFDDEDDDDLFASKKTEQKSQATPKSTQAQEKPSKSQEIVFNDPLSMFDDD